VHDDPDTVHRGLDTLVPEQITGHLLDTVRGLVGASAEHTYVTARVLQARNDLAAERAGAASDQDA
jgi:hypothetical protein